MGVIRDAEIVLFGKIEQVLIGFSVILDHLRGKRLYFSRFGFFQRQLAGLDLVALVRASANLHGPAQSD